MAFVKLDCGLLDSTLWGDRLGREVFITALLMAEPRECREPMPQIAVRSLEATGFVVPPGWYGFVPAAGTGIVSRAVVEREPGLDALTRLGEPDPESRTPDFEGRRLVRVNRGYLVLNFFAYRDRDYTAKERQQRWRDRKRNAVSTSDNGVTGRNVTHAEAEAEATREGRKEGPSGTGAEVQGRSTRTHGPMPVGDLIDGAIKDVQRG